MNTTAEDVLRKILPDAEVGAALRAIYVEQIRAYARECVEAWLEKAAQIVEETPHGMHYGPGVEDFIIANVEVAIDSIKSELAHALRALPVETP